MRKSFKNYAFGAAMLLPVATALQDMGPPRDLSSLPDLFAAYKESGLTITIKYVHCYAGRNEAQIVGALLSEKADKPPPLQTLLVDHGTSKRDPAADSMSMYTKDQPRFDAMFGLGATPRFIRVQETLLKKGDAFCTPSV